MSDATRRSPGGATARVCAAMACGATVHLVSGFDARFMALVANLCVLWEAGLLSARLQKVRRAGPASLLALANLPVSDSVLFERAFGATVRRTAVVGAFALTWFAQEALQAGLATFPSVALAIGCALMLWGVALASLIVLAASLPRIPLVLRVGITVLLVALVFGSGASGVDERLTALTSGWVLEIFTGAVQHKAAWTALQMCGLLVALGVVNLSWLRSRYRVPQLMWRQVPGELVVDLLVRQEAVALARASAGAEGSVPEVLRQRAARNVAVSIREAVASGGWRSGERPIGPVERLIHALLSAEQRALASFVAPLRRDVTQGFLWAAVGLLAAALAGALGLPASVQGIAFVAIMVAALSVGRIRTLPACVLQGALPVDPITLLWISLKISTIRVGLWLPFLLVQARIAATCCAMPTAPFLAVRFALLVLALQPLAVVTHVGGEDADAGSARGWGAAVSRLLPLITAVLSAVAVARMVAEPPFAETGLVAAVALLSLGAFVAQGLRLQCDDGHR